MAARREPPDDGVFRGALTATLRDAEGARQEAEPAAPLARRVVERREGICLSGHKSEEYVDELDDSRFCIIPRGNTPWTRRFFDAAVRGCIPAVLSDPVSFPFERLLDFRAFSLKLPERWAPRLAAELRATSAAHSAPSTPRSGACGPPSRTSRAAAAYEMASSSSRSGAAAVWT